MTEQQKEIPGYELELGKGKRKIFVRIEFEPLKIWIDTKGLPDSATLCAMCDAIPFSIAKCGNKYQHERYFVDMEWAINDWGGPEDIVEALKRRKQMIIDDLPKMKEKYENAYNMKS